MNKNRRVAISHKTVETRDDRDRLISSRVHLTATYDAAVLPVDTPTANGNIYPRAVMEKALADFRGVVGEGGGLGEFNPENPGVVSLHNISHRVTEARLDGDAVRVKITTLDTPSGHALANLLDHAHEEPGAFPFELLPRGVGSQSDDKVGEDYKILSFDFVTTPPAVAHPRRESTGYVQWPQGLHDDGQGGMVVYALFRHRYAVYNHARGWSKAPGLYAKDWQIDKQRPLDPGVLAAVPLGYSFGCWWYGDPGPESAYYERWECKREHLTSDGLALVELLEKLYGAPAEFVTFIST